MSIENIWRETLYFYEFRFSDFTRFKIKPTAIMEKLILAGEPFEIIDGDSLNF